MKIVILGRPISKKNSKQMIWVGGKPTLISSKAFLQFEKDALRQIVLKGEKVKPPYFVNYEFQMKGKMDTDLDNMIAGINDVLQKAGAFLDDKLITMIGAKKMFGFDDWKTIIEIDNYASNTEKT